jgi:hypothetical protein
MFSGWWSAAAGGGTGGAGAASAAAATDDRAYDAFVARHGATHDAAALQQLREAINFFRPPPAQLLSTAAGVHLTVTVTSSVGGLAHRTPLSIVVPPTYLTPRSTGCVVRVVAPAGATATLSPAAASFVDAATWEVICPQRSLSLLGYLREIEARCARAPPLVVGAGHRPGRSASPAAEMTRAAMRVLNMSGVEARRVGFNATALSVCFTATVRQRLVVVPCDVTVFDVEREGGGASPPVVLVVPSTGCIIAPEAVAAGLVDDAGRVLRVPWHGSGEEACAAMLTDLRNAFSVVCPIARGAALPPQPRPSHGEKLSAPLPPRQSAPSCSAAASPPPHADVEPLEQPRTAEPATPPAAAAPPAAPPTTGDAECLVCMDARREWLCVPCGHVVYCGDCKLRAEADRLPCPTCRQAVSQLVKVFM